MSLENVRTWPVIGTVLTVLWLFVREVSLLSASMVGELIIGFIIGMSTSYILRRMYVDTVNIRRMLSVTPYVIAYLGSFLTELVKANIAVMKIVLSPGLPIKPAVIEIPLRVRSDAAITLIANSITLTPGTVTMDYNPAKNALYVHAIAVQDKKAVLEPIRHWEDLALTIFDEDESIFEILTKKAQKSQRITPEVEH